MAFAELRLRPGMGERKRACGHGYGTARIAGRKYQF